MGESARRATAYRELIADVYELAGLSRSSSEEIARAHGQSVARWHTLSVLSAEPITVASASRRLGLARQSVQRVVDELKRDGCVLSTANPDDARAPLIELTGSGQRVLSRLTRAGDAHRSGVLQEMQLDAGSLSQAQVVLRQLIEALRK